MNITKLDLRVGKWIVNIHEDFVVLVNDERTVFCFSTGMVEVTEKKPSKLVKE